MNKMSEEQKIQFNKANHEDNMELGRKQVCEEFEWIMLVYFKKPFVCRHEGCQNMTTAVVIADLGFIEKLMGKPVSGMVMFNPLCPEHYQEIRSELLVANAENKAGKWDL